MDNKLRLVGQIKEDNNLVGYAVLNIDTNKVSMLTLKEVEQLVESGIVENAEINWSKRKIEGTEASLGRLPEFDVQGSLTANPRITILAEMVKSYNDRKILGYYVMDAFGRRARFSIEDTLKLIEKYEATNAKVVNRNGAKIISAIYGEFDSRYAHKDNNKEPERFIKREKFERPMNKARYLTDGYVYYKRINDYTQASNRECIEVIDGEHTILHANITGLSYVTYKYSDIVKKLETGKCGARTKKHYSNTDKAIKEYGAKDKRVKVAFRKDLVLYSLINRVDKLNGKLKDIVKQVIVEINNTNNEETIILATILNDSIICNGKIQNHYIIHACYMIWFKALDKQPNVFGEYNNILLEEYENWENWSIKQFKKKENKKETIEIVDNIKYAGAKIFIDNGNLVYVKDDKVVILAKSFRYTRYMDAKEILKEVVGLRKIDDNKYSVVERQLDANIYTKKYIVLQDGKIMYGNKRCKLVGNKLTVIKNMRTIGEGDWYKAQVMKSFDGTLFNMYDKNLLLEDREITREQERILEKEDKAISRR